MFDDFSYFWIILPLLLLFLLYSFRLLKEYERGVFFLLGRYQGTKGPGLTLVIPFIQQIARVDLRIVTIDVPSQDIISRDNVAMKVNAVIYFRVFEPEKAIIQVEDYRQATIQLAQTILRSVLSHHELDSILAERDKLKVDIQQLLDKQTNMWGVKIVMVEIKHIDLGETTLRAMSLQAEAEREHRAKMIHAHSELQTAEKLVQAAAVLAKQPYTLQLRYLQTMTEVADKDKSHTVIFPLPIDLLLPLQRKLIQSAASSTPASNKSTPPSSLKVELPTSIPTISQPPATVVKSMGKNKKGRKFAVYAGFR